MVAAANPFELVPLRTNGLLASRHCWPLKFQALSFAPQESKGFRIMRESVDGVVTPHTGPPVDVATVRCILQQARVCSVEVSLQPGMTNRNYGDGDTAAACGHDNLIQQSTCLSFTDMAIDRVSIFQQHSLSALLTNNWFEPALLTGGCKWTSQSSSEVD